MNRYRPAAVPALVLAFFVTAQAFACDRDKAAFICGLTNAEDLVRLPGTSWVIASHIDFDFNFSPPRSVGLGPVEAVRIDTRQVQRLYPRPDSAVNWDRKLYPDCSAPPENIALAGLNARPLGASRFRLYLTNHGGRQSVEIIDLTIQGEKLHTSWRGCVRAPEYVWPNSVAPLPNDAFVLSGGKVAIWRPGQGWTKLEGHTGTGSNGVEVSSDGKWIFIADAGQVVRVPVAGGTASSVHVPADNLRWGEDGYLYVVHGLPKKSWESQSTEWRRKEGMKCFTQVFCDLPFAVVQIDPDALTAKEIFRTSDEGMKGFGIATTALQVDGQFWIGTVRGDSVAVVPSKH